MPAAIDRGDPRQQKFQQIPSNSVSMAEAESPSPHQRADGWPRGVTGASVSVPIDAGFDAAPRRTYVDGAAVRGVM